jgi:Polyphosphate kinase 2 (PPK2)
VLKFFLNVSKDEQKRRFLERLNLPEKNWKFSASDVREREHWDDYIDAYEDLFNHTSTEWAPWYIIPADHKWVTHLAVAAIIYFTLSDLKVKYPTVSEETKQELILAKKRLEEEDGGKISGKEDEGEKPEKTDNGKRSYEHEGEKPQKTDNGKRPDDDKGKKHGKSKKKRGRKHEKA